MVHTGESLLNANIYQISSSLGEFLKQIQGGLIKGSASSGLYAPKVKLSRNSIDSFKDILRKFSFDIHNFSFNKEAIMMKTKDNDYVYY